jgi:hypothetical protein
MCDVNVTWGIAKTQAAGVRRGGKTRFAAD